MPAGLPRLSLSFRTLSVWIRATFDEGDHHPPGPRDTRRKRTHDHHLRGARRLTPISSRACARRHHRPLSHPGAHHPRRPRRPRRLRQGQDRLGQDPRLRPPARRSASARPSRSQPTGLVLVPTRELANQVSDVARPARRGARPHGAGRLRRRRLRWPADRRAAARASTSSSARPAASSTSSSAATSRSTRSRCSCSTRPTAWPTWASCPRCRRSSTGITRPHQTMLFSATLDGAVKRLVDRYMNDPVVARGASPTSRPSTRWSTASSSCTRWTR